MGMEEALAGSVDPYAYWDGEGSDGVVVEGGYEENPADYLPDPPDPSEGGESDSPDN